MAGAGRRDRGARGLHRPRAHADLLRARASTDARDDARHGPRARGLGLVLLLDRRARPGAGAHDRDLHGRDHACHVHAPRAGRAAARPRARHGGSMTRQKPIRSILAATDFSPDAMQAVRRAGLLAALLDARLKLLHVIDVPPLAKARALIGGEDLRAAYKRSAARKLEDAIKVLP